MISEQLFKELCFTKTSGVMATVISSDGQGPARPGDNLLWAEGKHLCGTVGGGSNEQQVLEACAALTTQQSVVEISSFFPGTLPSCGGTLEVKLERVDFGNPEQAAFWKKEQTRNPPGNLYLMGAGHVAREVAWLADRNQFQVTVVDPRGELLQAEHFPEDTILHLERGVQFFSENRLASSDFIIIAGPDHATDLAVLEEALTTSAHYLGVMGSRKKIASFKNILKKKDLWQAVQGRLYAPIGIPISSKSPIEVAVSIVAELIQVRAQSSTKQYGSRLSVISKPLD